MKKIMMALAVVLMFGCATTNQEQIIKETINMTQENNFEVWIKGEMYKYQLFVQAQTKSTAKVTIVDWTLFDSHSAGLVKVQVDVPDRKIVGYFIVLRPTSNWSVHSFILVSDEPVENEIKQQLEASKEENGEDTQ